MWSNAHGLYQLIVRVNIERPGDDSISRAGNSQQFARTLERFESFAVALSFISITTGEHHLSTDRRRPKLGQRVRGSFVAVITLGGEPTFDSRNSRVCPGWSWAQRSTSSSTTYAMTG